MTLEKDTGVLGALTGVLGALLACLGHYCGLLVVMVFLFFFKDITNTKCTHDGTVGCFKKLISKIRVPFLKLLPTLLVILCE